MGCQFLDSFDHYTTIDQMLSKWTWLQFATVVPGRNGQGCLLQAGAGLLSKSLKHTNIWITGFAIYFNTGGSFGPDAINFYAIYNTGQPLFSLQLNSDGSLNLTSQGPAGGIMGTTSELVPPFYVKPHRWYFMEVKVEITGGSDVSITASLNVDGAQLLINVSGNTGLNSANFIVPAGTGNFHQFSGTEGLGGVIIDDVRIMDTSGSFNNDFLGDLGIFCLYPRQDVLTQWTGLVPGNQYSQINATSPLGDSSYVYASQPPDSPMNATDNFLWQQIPLFFGDLFAVQLSVYARKDAEGTRAIQTFTSGSGMTSDVFYLDDDYIYYTFCMNSNAGIKWDILSFNARSFGFMLVV